MLVNRMTGPQPLTRLRGEMDRLFGKFFGDYEPYRAWDPFSLRRFPNVNLWQDDAHVFVEAEIPGLTKDDIELTVTGNELTLKGERSDLDLPEETLVHRRERGAGAFSRIIHIPVDVNDAEVEAVLRNGVLTVTLMKADIARSRRIPVKTLSA